MGNEPELGKDELMTMFGLICIVIFMTASAYYTSKMVDRMNEYAELSYGTDKIEVTSVYHEAHDPFIHNAYGALMYGWIYDYQSEVPIVWMGPDVNNKTGESPDYSLRVNTKFLYANPLSMYENRNIAMLSSVFDDGTPVSNFASWKPGVIGGTSNPNHIGKYNNVLKVIKNSAKYANTAMNATVATDAEKVYKLYRGEYDDFYFHLEYTPNYTENTDNTDYIERKNSQWVLILKRTN